MREAERGGHADAHEPEPEEQIDLLVEHVVGQHCTCMRVHYCTVLYG